MPLKLMYITNRTGVAQIAEQAGVERIFIDMEYIGKELRQAGMNTVKSGHTIEDVKTIRKVVSKSELLVRVNPIHEATADYCSSEDEIKEVLDEGADVIMLPMYKSVAEVERFLKAVNGRAKTQMLAETIEAADIMEEIIKIKEADEIHIGLNDLHIATGKKFMFELLSDGTVDRLCDIIKTSDKPFGFGGIARIGYGMLPAEYVIREHYRIGSTCAILSRAFCNADKMDNLEEIDKLFKEEMINIRKEEEFAAGMSARQRAQNKATVARLVDEIVKEMK